jgi:tetratricopeptide (TPR) repeat protein
VTQEFHLSVTPIRNNEYLVRTEIVADGVPLGEEQVVWQVEDWLTEASLLMDDPLNGFWRSGNIPAEPSRSASRPNSSTRFFPHGSGQPAANLAAFGQRLYNELFYGTIRDSWMMAQGIAQHRREGLRLRLGLKGIHLHRLPWEVLYAGDRPLATGTDVVFSRYHSGFPTSTPHLRNQPASSAVNQPLKILMVLSAPSDQEVLALKQEADHLKQELQTVAQIGRAPDIELTILEQPGREQLTQALEHNHYQVLHYAGHSNLGAAGGSLYLVSRKTGLTEVLSGDDLAGLLVNNGIHMAVFNSCRGVYGATETATADLTNGNLSEALVRRGIPAVLAMAERIPDDVALNLSRLFYRNLKQGYPVDLSLSRARQGLISSYGSDQLYWALPILYLHSEFDGYLLPTGAPGEQSNLDLINFSQQDDLLDGDLLNGGLHNGAAEIDDYLPYAEAANGHITHEEDLPAEFEEAIFADAEAYQTEAEKVARFVYELSHNPTQLETDDRSLYASLTEDLLETEPRPEPSDYLDLPENPTFAASNPGSKVGNSSVVPAVSTNRADMYAALEKELATMGKLTPAIAESTQAVHKNPTSAEAYTNIGWALYEEGYLNEAIAAYNDAIRLDPTYAKAFNRLGLAFFQHGKPTEAVKAYSRAVELDPTLTEASTNLRAILDRDPAPPQKPVPPAEKLPVPLPSAATAKKSRLWLWSGIAAVLATGLLGSWAFSRHLINAPKPSPAPTSSASPINLSTLDPSATVALATQQLNQNNLPEFQRTVEAMLDRSNTLKEVETLLKTVPAPIADTPTIHFLKGRLAWQAKVAGDKNYTVSMARQEWEVATKANPTAQSLNALGFAYYAEGKLAEAEQAWQRSLQLPGNPPTPASQNSTPPPVASLVLTARAGLALVGVKQAEQGAINQQLALRSKALDLRNQVTTQDPVNFKPEVLGKNWMWSEKTIQDWKALLAMK